MATYKSEFRSRHYKDRWRPRAAYAMGQIHRWSALASHLPRAANWAMRTPGLADLAKRIGGIAPQREMPAFATETFGSWHSKNAKKTNGKRVILWPDTFNNYFRPTTAIAATHLLEREGFRVDIPTVRLCCGRPLYDWGWLEQAKSLWRRTLDALQTDIEDGVPLIGLEPACTSAFRDELPALFPNDPRAQALAKQTFFLTEFLRDRGFKPELTRGLPSHAVAQLHCHHHAVLDESAERAILNALPFSCDVLAKGCCGMAGSFGFEAGKYDLSMRIGEQGILPSIRDAHLDTTIIANGFSCREQIEQATRRPTVHIAELLESVTR
jgi:Fe-S oxidoreductase